MKGLGSIPTGGNFFHWIVFCFHIVKPLLPILALLPFLRIQVESVDYYYMKNSERCLIKGVQ